jgi:hypothetical protein
VEDVAAAADLSDCLDAFAELAELDAFTALPELDGFVPPSADFAFGGFSCKTTQCRRAD